MKTLVQTICAALLLASFNASALTSEQFNKIEIGISNAAGNVANKKIDYCNSLSSLEIMVNGSKYIEKSKFVYFAYRFQDQRTRNAVLTYINDIYASKYQRNYLVYAKNKLMRNTTCNEWAVYK